CRDASTFRSGSIPCAPTTCHRSEYGDRHLHRKTDDECDASRPRKSVRLRAPASHTRSENIPPISEFYTHDASAAGDSSSQCPGCRKSTIEKSPQKMPAT